MNISTLLKKTLLLFLFLYLYDQAHAQQFSLYNSRTLYDTFENPSQKAYQVDTSRRYAFNFFIPTITFNGAFSGPAEPAFKSLIYDGGFNGSEITIGKSERNTLAFNTNTYIAMLRILKAVKNNQEMGFSWQVRNDARMEITNETFAIFDDRRFFSANSYQNLFNDEGYNQSYHQFSFNYRQDYKRRLELGAKVSLLSGISYTALKVYQSELNIDDENDVIDVALAGTLRSIFKFDNIEKEMAYPHFKNPGLSVTAGASYKFRDGWFLLGNLKDIGFIKWSKNSYEYNFNTGPIKINNASNSSADNRLADSLNEKISSTSVSRSYISAVNGKVEVLLNKDFGNYQPNLILSKSVFYKGGDIALINNYHFKDYVFTVSADYNTNKFFQLGGQFMIKSPNTEFFIGSDQLFKTFETIKNFNRGSSPYASGYTGASFYLGFGLKFGPVLEHQANATQIPGFRGNSDRGFLKRLFGKKG